MKTLFLCAALALPMASDHIDGGEDTYKRETFIKEYKQLREILSRIHPGHEFLIVPNKMARRAPEGWIQSPYVWWGHVIYIRRIRELSLRSC